jgi:hypothetical protein
MESSYATIVAVLERYFDGLYRGDSRILADVFHPAAIYASATGGKLLALQMNEYFPIVDARPSPASKGESRADRIIAIEFAGPATAFARVECAIAPKHFTDLLTLIFVDGKWQIISKVFHFELAAV